MLVFVTGVAGSGKSTLASYLAGRGHRAVDADDGVSRHVRSSDGAPVKSPPRARQTADWAAGHEFRFDLARVSALAAGATPQDPAFLLGAAWGDEEVIAVAGLSFYLDVEEGELRRRLSDRPPGSYGQAPHELESILAWHAAAAQRYEALGALRLDAGREVGQIAGELLAATASIGSHAPGPLA